MSYSEFSLAQVKKLFGLTTLEKTDLFMAIAISSLSSTIEQLFVSAPVMMVVEAKNEDITRGIGQCSEYYLDNIAQIFGILVTSISRYLNLNEDIGG